MNLAVSLRSEFIKIKRTASLWVAFLGAGFIPFIFFISYVHRPGPDIERLKSDPWAIHFYYHWQSFAAFLLPMFVTLICAQVVQLEFKNNTWKQVFASPQRIGNIYFSKLIVIVANVLLLLALFNVFVLASAWLVNLIHGAYSFLSTTPDWFHLLRLNSKVFVSLLGIIAIQYWLSLRIKNFFVPIGIGIVLSIAAMIIMSWEQVYKFPYAYPFLTLMAEKPELARKPLLLNHELNSLGYFLFFTLLGYADFFFRKEKG